jgi:uncharacterized DUF497 family protein
MINTKISGFQWDIGNKDKCQKHGVTLEEIEFAFSRPLAIFPDGSHSQFENRYMAIGKTQRDRSIFVIFTLRQQGPDTFIRPISARYMHAKEVLAYDDAKKKNPDLP